MPSIHPSTVKRATKMGIIVEAVPDGGVRAWNPRTGIEAIQPDAKSALDECITKVGDFDEQQATMPPAVDLDAGGLAAPPEPPAKADTPRNKSGVALDGAIAYTEGTMTADCPFDVESEDEEEQGRANAWYDAWDAAADEAQSVEEDAGAGGSVVAAKYRAKYAEDGHPTHCGDWLAELLINLTTNSAGINTDLFESICAANGVDLSKYKHEGRGWQGRLRMTGRNLLVKVVRRDGKLVLPDGGVHRAPKDWLAAQAAKGRKAA